GLVGGGGGWFSGANEKCSRSFHSRVIQEFLGICGRPAAGPPLKTECFIRRCALRSSHVQSIVPPSTAGDRPAMMLPASDLAEIVTNLVGLRLEPTTTAAVLGAVLPPLLRSSETPTPAVGQPQSKPRSAAPRRKREKSGPRVAAAAWAADEPTDGPRVRARAALKANPNATLADVAKLARCSHGTAINARNELAAEARKVARDELPADARKPRPSERRERAQRFLRDALAHGPKQVSAVEEAAAKAHVDPQALEQARADLGVVTSRANTGGPHAVQWSLPG